MSEPLDTSLTLIARLHQRPTDQGAWEQFVARYSNVLLDWCRRWSLQDADAQDVVQNVLLELSRHIQSYEHRPNAKFRSWLKTVARRAWYDCTLKRGKRDVDASGSVFESLEARESLVQRIDEECVREILELAAQRVQARVEPNTWQAFALMTFDGLSGEEAAQRLGIKAGAVFVARSRVRRLIQQEYRRIDSSEDDA